jgi:hypothetical protein
LPKDYEIFIEPLTGLPVKRNVFYLNGHKRVGLVKRSATETASKLRLDGADLRYMDGFIGKGADHDS